MHRQADGARLVHDGALDVLPDPPRSVGGKAEAAFRIEFLQRVDHTQIAFLDQIKQRHAAVRIMLGDVHHQPQIVFDHFLARLEITLFGKARITQLVLGAQ